MAEEAAAECARQRARQQAGVAFQGGLAVRAVAFEGNLAVRPGDIGGDLAVRAGDCCAGEFPSIAFLRWAERSPCGAGHRLILPRLGAAVLDEHA